MHELALRLVPESPTTLACLAMLHAINGNLEVAVDYLHRSVGVQPSSCASTSSNVASTMLNVCIEALTGKGIYASNHKVGKGKGELNRPAFLFSILSECRKIDIHYYGVCTQISTHKISTVNIINQLVNIKE